jgi:hypothetical protein
VNCEVCGTELPHGAMFCGECGTAVGTRTARTVHPDSGMPVDSSDQQPGDAVSTVVATDPRDTAIIEPILRDKLPELETELPPAPAEHDVVEDEAARDKTGGDESIEIEQDLPPEVVDEEDVADLEAADHEVEDEAASREVAAELPAIDPVDDGPVAAPQPLEEPPSRIPLRPDPFPWGDRGSAIFSDSDELEQTLIVPRRDTGERFVLQFSTGESVTVFGSGLLGRNPTPQPTEYFDQLVSITDPGKSVSKTHLEFGQEAGSFWVSDRFSGNGSTVREPESSPRRLVAGKRYRIVRGTRVDIGEQFFVVS